MTRSSRRRWLRRAAIAVCSLAVYPTFVLCTVYAHCIPAKLPGGRDGPGDAYRHTLASATVAYTGSPRWVEWATTAMEGNGSRAAANAMDVHNNRIGARIGTEAKSWDEMQRHVFAAVEAGAVNTEDSDRITWLPAEKWRNRLY